MIMKNTGGCVCVCVWVGDNLLAFIYNYLNTIIMEPSFSKVPVIPVKVFHAVCNLLIKDLQKFKESK